MTKTIRIYSKEMQSKEGRKYFKYTYVNGKGAWYEVKFRHEITNIPREKGYFKLTFDVNECNIKKIPSEDGVFTPNPQLWLKSIIECTLDKEYMVEREKALKEELESIFED